MIIWITTAMGRDDSIMTDDELDDRQVLIFCWHVNERTKYVPQLWNWENHP